MKIINKLLKHMKYNVVNTNSTNEETPNVSIEEKIDIMQAFANGLQIECKECSDPDADWRDINNPNWDWYHYTYRIKPAAPTKPYDNAKEIFEDQNKHGYFIKSKNDDIYYFFNAINDMTKTAYIPSQWISFEDLYNDYVWVDGEVFGKLNKYDD